MAQKGYRQRRNNNEKKNANHDVLGVTLVIISLFLLLCIVIPPILSVVSRAVFNVMLGVFGIASYPMLVGVLTWGVLLLLKRTVYMSKKNVVCTALLIFFGLIIFQLASTHAFLKESFSEYISDVYDAKYSVGGVVFGTIAFGLKSAITEIGCYVVFSVAALATVAVLVNVIGRIKARRSSVAPVAIAKPTQPASSFTTRTEPQRVVPVEPQNNLYVGQIARKAPKIGTETGRASEIPQREPRRVTDYSASPIIEKEPEHVPQDDPSAARFALYGDSDTINEQETREFVNRAAREEPPAPASSAYVVPPQRYDEPSTPRETFVEPYVRVSEDAQANTAGRPRKIDHDDSPDMQVFFPTPKKFDFNDDDIISADDDIKARLQADMRKRKIDDIEGIQDADDRKPEPFRFSDLTARREEREAPHIESIEDIFTAPPSAPPSAPPARQTVDNSAEIRFMQEREAERAREEAARKTAEPRDEIIDAFAMREMYDTKESAPEPAVNPDDIINADAVDAVRREERNTPEQSVIIDGSSSEFDRKPEPATVTARAAEDEGIVDASEFDIPAIDLSETRDVTSDIIDGGESSGMYVPADDFGIEEAPAPKPKQKKNAPLDNQITIDAVLKARADESVVLNETVRRKKYNYAPPPISLLKTYDKADSSADELQETAAVLERVIGGFLKTDEIKVINIVPGPTVTRYEVEVPSGVSVKQIESRCQDIEYELASPSHIRIEAPIPGKRAVGIEVPNMHKSIVGLREMIESPEFAHAKSPMTVSVGKDISGGTVLCDLVKVPHLLIAGQTGSGKSACLNGLIVSLLYKSSPEDLRFILVDPKRVEFSAYRSMPHLLFDGIIYEPNEVLSALKWACVEMERRYALMAKYGRNQLATFNELPDVTSGRIDKLPHIIIIIDELADIMQSAVKRDIEDRIKVIAAKARAAGIHLIVATQRPSADVLTGTIKTNLTSRIAFKVSAQLDSRIILDAQGAEALVGNGDMLFFPVEYSAPRRVQGSYISDDEVASVITYIKENFECDFDEDAARAVFNTGGGAGGGMGGAGGEKEDALLPDVLALVIRTGQASISTIQRRFSIGYARAARIVDGMEELGYIGPSTGSSKPREVYITADKYRDLYGRDIDDN